MPKRDLSEIISDLVFEMTVPAGLRPRTDNRIDEMLDAVGGVSPSEDTSQRMLRKIRGEETVGECATELHGSGIAEDSSVEFSEEELALWRKREEDIPPEIRKALQDMEDAMLNEQEDESDNSDDENADE